MHWFYLFIAALLETAWTYSIKFLSFRDVLTLRFHNFYLPEKLFPVVLPFFGYVFFGIGNIYFFSLAMKFITPSIAFAVWTATTLILMKLFDGFYFHQPITTEEMIYSILIIIGIIGLKSTAQK
jgi:quaternary ammonium compound-resistance protein SugE